MGSAERARGLIRLACLLAAVCVPAPPALGQIIEGQASLGKLSLIHTSWRIRWAGHEETLSQTLIPFSGFMPLGAGGELRLSFARVADDLDLAAPGAPDRSYSLAGLTDLRVQWNQSLKQHRFLFGVGANLPTGKRSMDLGGGWEIMRRLSYDYLLVPNRRPGEGLGVDLLAGVAALAGNTRLGTAVAYYYDAAYEAFAGAGDYDPGDRIRVSASAQQVGDRGSWSGDLSLAAYGDDTLDGTAFYSRGNELALHLAGIRTLSAFELRGDGRYLIRGRSPFYGVGGAIRDQLQTFGDELAFDGRLAWRPDPSWELCPLFEFHHVSANELGLGAARTAALGLLAVRRFDSKLDLGAAIKRYAGNADDEAIDLIGTQFMATLSKVF